MRFLLGRSKIAIDLGLKGSRCPHQRLVSMVHLGFTNIEPSLRGLKSLETKANQEEGTVHIRPDFSPSELDWCVRNCEQHIIHWIWTGRQRHSKAMKSQRLHDVKCTRQGFALEPMFWSMSPRQS